MTDPYFQTLFADRIGGAQYGQGTAIYKFEKIKRAKRAAIKDFPGRPLLDFGIGENDQMANPSVRQVLAEEAGKLENRGYADNGIQQYKDAAAAWMKRSFGVTLDPATEVNHCIGSKTALAMLPAVFINPGDITLMTVPGYPIAGTHTRYYGGAVFSLPLRAENSFLPDLDIIPGDILRRAKMLVLNYPNSPTGGLADETFFRKVIDFAHRHELVVVNDAAHVMLTYGRKPLSFLAVQGAREVGVEVHSMSKGFDMIGWRLGFVAGNERIVRAFADVKDNCDSGQFMAIQKAGVAALADDSIPQRVRARYERRLNKLVATLRELGFDAHMPGGTYFLYTKAPRGIDGGQIFKTAEDVSQFLIRERSICTVPWDDAGACLRFSVTYQAPTEADENALMAALKQRLAGDRFVW
ncbi:MAG TPA: LL-diaminopimelate aminotransferase [Phycisphaerae bacterium]|nr:LL-diaminopimelate aminotransferase [Phycisphaerae bacterium]HRY66730.1 LL-diaminopimelate aminotransferase [Phycisphaerae bacterium]HSA29020.1 LL-diaminopimelate aminotransferase [Phycisphaerae bacterium]